jgi:hypothetical protein
MHTVALLLLLLLPSVTSINKELHGRERFDSVSADVRARHDCVPAHPRLAHLRADGGGGNGRATPTYLTVNPRVLS